ncbi:MAG TPA: cupin domain-containing protein [Fimbriiglobus sp.]|nr:cupin domain-containing protein [Fimbriiglobus sp.]
MFKRNWKLLSAGLLVACAIGGFALKSAWATPSRDYSGVPVARPVVVEELQMIAANQTHAIVLKTRGEWETRVVNLRIGPGGYTGWHSHPGPAFVMVTKGTLTVLQADDLDIPVEYHAGEGFVEQIDNVHIASNTGDVAVELTAFLLIPKGAPPSVDEADPRD